MKMGTFRDTATDHRHRRLLRTCRERPRRRTTEQRDELAPSHARLQA